MTTRSALMLVILLSQTIFMSSGKSCSKDKGTRAMCPFCNPVCGSDGYTYTDECFLNAYKGSCRKNVTIVKAGVCRKVKSVPVEECYPASSACPKSNVGTNVADLVCGSDGKSYGNACTFHAQRKSKRDLEFVKCGEC